MINGQKQIWQIKSPNYMNLHFSTESRVSLNMDGVFGISNIIAILAPQMQGPCSFGINLHISHIISVKYDKFWRFGFKSVLQKSFVQRILLPRQIGSSLSFRPRRSLQEVKVWPRSRRWGKVARLVRGLKDDFGAFWNYRASFHVTASSLPGLPLESGCCHRNLRRFQPSQFIQPLWLEIEVLLEIADM